MLDLGWLSTRTCQSVHRRSLLQVGACSAFGMGMSAWMNRPGVAAMQGGAKVKSVLLLWLWGGPSHHETWDPKPEAPVQIRGAFSPISTATSGTQICELLPQLARRTDRFAIIRSMNHDQKDHNVGGTIGLTGHVHGAKASGGIPFPGNVRPCMGSVVSYLKRSEAGEWPGFMAIGPNCKVSGENLRGQLSGALGAAHDPFRIEGFTFDDGVKMPQALEPIQELGAGRLTRRRDLLNQVDLYRRQFDALADVGRYSDLEQKAFSLVTAAASKALNLDLETEALRDRYGRTVYGQNLILARRLVESGVPFVQVNWSGDAEDEQQGGDGGWDLHYRLFERMQERYCPIFDKAFSALLDDLQERGLLDTTLVLAMGEFGRSPQISGIAGREHWPFVYSAVMAGGGVPGGLVLGSSTPDGGYVKTQPVHPANVVATILEKMGLDRLALGDRDASILEGPVPELS
jgi:hypothetical protein